MVDCEMVDEMVMVDCERDIEMTYLPPSSTHIIPPSNNHQPSSHQNRNLMSQSGVNIKISAKQQLLPNSSERALKMQVGWWKRWLEEMMVDEMVGGRYFDINS